MGEPQWRLLRLSWYDLVPVGLLTHQYPRVQLDPEELETLRSRMPWVEGVNTGTGAAMEAALPDFLER